MKPLYTKKEFEIAKGLDKMPLECLNCKNKFYIKKTAIKSAIKDNSGRGKYCGHKCSHSVFKIRKIFNCEYCNKECNRRKSDYDKAKKHFCNHSCATKYQNLNKTTGYRRSKLEIWLEDKLKVSYPKQKFLFNDRTAIKSELDFYLPNLKLAFELNGILHYEPIYGKDKLDQIQNNDNRKFQACLEKGIELCIIDSSSFGYFKENKAWKYLDMIKEIINLKLNNSV